MDTLYEVGTPTNVVMKPLFALLAAAVVVIGTVPAGVAAASPEASPADLGTGPGPAQVQDNGTTTSTSTSTATPTDSEPTATETAGENDTTAEPDGNESNGTASAGGPGAQLAGALAVQGTEVESEVSSRAFGQRVAAAASNGSRAAIVAGEVNDSRERLADLRSRLEELEAAREAGNISEGRYRAETARIAAEIGSVERRLEQSNETAASLPADVRAANGINTSSIQRLRTEARNLSGPEVAAIARSIGGQGSGRGLGDNVGPPGRSGGASAPRGPPADADRGPPEERSGNGSGGEGAESNRGPGNGDGNNGNAADRGNGNGDGSDRGNGNGGSDGGNNPQESEANRSDRENGEGQGSGSDGNGGSNDSQGGGNDNRGNDGGNGSQGGNGDGGGSDNQGGSNGQGGSGNGNSNDNRGGNGNAA